MYVCVCVCVFVCMCVFRIYVIVVEHDLSVLDYLSDFVCCLYGVPSAYGTHTVFVCVCMYVCACVCMMYDV